MSFFKEVIDEFENTGKIKDTETLKRLKKILEYIEVRHRKLKDDLSEKDKQFLYAFIVSKRYEDIFVLKFGEIEDYFPEISKNRSLESIIEFITTEKFDEWYKGAGKNDARNDLEQIVLEILNGKSDSSR